MSNLRLWNSKWEHIVTLPDGIGINRDGHVVLDLDHAVTQTIVNYKSTNERDGIHLTIDSADKRDGYWLESFIVIKLDNGHRYVELRFVRDEEIRNRLTVAAER